MGLLCDKTSFYYESGGQIYDIGCIEAEDESWKFIVENTQVYGGYVVHSGYLEKGSAVSVGDLAKLA